MKEAVLNRHRLGKILLLVGALLGLALASLAAWAEVEASQYGFVRYTRDRLSSLRCPVFIGPHETLPITVTVTNRKADYRASFSVRITKSSPLMFETDTERFRLNPGERRVLRWTIGPDNIDLDHFIFVDVYQHGGYPNKPLQAQCGVFVLPVDIPGNVFLWGGILLTLGLLWGGWLLWQRGLRSWETQTGFARGLTALAILVPVTMGVAFWGHWALAIPLIVLNLFFVLGVLLYLVLQVE